MNLSEQKCVPCEGNFPPLTRAEAEGLLVQIPAWTIANDGLSITRAYILTDFKSALQFVNKIGDIAEAQGHHPDIHITDYKHVTVVLSTHAIHGLSVNDFIVAKKIDA